VEDLSIPIENTVMIHNTVADSNNNSYPQRVGNFNILTLGNIVEYKNIDLWLLAAIKVCSIKPYVNFIWAGKCIDINLFNRIVKSIPEELKDKIILRSQSDEPFDLVQVCDIYFHPSRKENHSLSILEAIYFGKPVVCAKIGGNPESVVNDMNGLLFEDNNLLEAITKLTILIEDQDKRELFSYNSRKLFLDKFSYDSWKKRMDVLFQF
jgi:glycosyltransferase involved in cell wall biosynthesis